MHPEFPHQAHTIYLNHASISPLSKSVVQALQHYIQQRHETHIENFFDVLPVLENVKQRFARMLNTQPERIAFVANTSTGFNLLAQGWPFRSGHRILLNSLEFPANVYPYLNLQSKGVQVDYVKPRGYELCLEDYADAMTSDTAWVSVSQVQFLTGQRVDLEALGELCHQKGVYLAVDGIQSLGATCLDVEKHKVDFVACGSHKWLMAPAGVGLVYVSERLQAQLSQSQVGWLSVENEWEILDYQMHLKPDAARYELGTPNLMALCGLDASLALFEKEGFDTVETRVLDLSDLLVRQFADWGLNLLTPLERKERLGIVSVQLENAEEIYHHLKTQGIQVSVREGQYLRIAPHFYNTQAEIERTLSVMSNYIS